MYRLYRNPPAPPPSAPRGMSMPRNCTACTGTVKRGPWVKSQF